MNQLKGSTSESQKSPQKEDRKKESERDANLREFRAGIAAIIFTAVGIGLVVILHKAFGIDDSATIVTLLIVPILIYGVISGRISEMKLPGGVEAKIRHDISVLKDEMQETGNIVSHVLQQTSVATTPSEMESRKIPEPEKELKELIEQYMLTRKKLEYGWERTMAMTSIMRKMINLAPQLAQFDVDGYLGADDQGARLAAYAYLYAKPQYEPERFRKLVDSVRTTIIRYKAFEQYWGLQAISKNLPQEGDEKLSSDVTEDLRSFTELIPRKTDRDYLLETVLSGIQD